MVKFLKLFEVSNIFQTSLYNKYNDIHTDKQVYRLTGGGIMTEYERSNLWKGAAVHKQGYREFNIYSPKY